MSRYHLLRVFARDDGAGGNELAVFLDAGGIPPERRHAIAAELGYSETVFVDDAAGGRLRIYTPATELPLAGHPLVGAAWLLARDDPPLAVLRPPAGEVPTWAEGELRWIRARPEWAPSFELLQLASSAEVDALDGPPDGGGSVDAWAWLDEDRGLVRARVFVPELGVAEDEATGAAALRLCAALGRPLEIHQGRGSLLLARPGPGGTAEVGGRVVLLDVVEHPL